MQRRFPQVKASDDALLQAWEKTLFDNRERPALFDATGNCLFTFAEIEKRANDYALKLKEFSAGEVIAIQIGNHPDWPSLFLASLRRKLVTLPLETTISDPQRHAAIETCVVAAAAVTLGKGVEILPAQVTKNAVIPSEVEGARGSYLKGLATGSLDFARDDVTLLKLTSGTTAAPRAIRFRSEQLLADCENICDTMEITARDLNFGVIPISHSYGFSNLLTPLLAHGVALALSGDRIPRAVAHGIAATRATVFPGMPIFYQSLCDLSDAPALPDLRLCISAGAPLTIELAEKFRAKFGREIHSFYGSSECGGICYVRRPQAIAGFVGEEMQGVEIEELASSTISVRSRAVGDGYFPEPDEAKLGHGFFMPDDLLEKIGGGFRIVGRVSDLINVAGKKVNPMEIEAELLRCHGVRAAVVFACESARRNQEVAACVVAERGVSEEELLRQLRAHLSNWQTPRRIHLVDSIPVNERGKTSRRELAKQFAVSK